LCHVSGISRAHPEGVYGEPKKPATRWLCWQSEANPSLPAKVGNAGRFRQKAARAATDPCTKSPHLNALDLPLPNLASRENPVHSREANTADKVFGPHRRLTFERPKK